MRLGSNPVLNDMKHFMMHQLDAYSKTDFRFYVTDLPVTNKKTGMEKIPEILPLKFTELNKVKESHPDYSSLLCDPLMYYSLIIAF